MSTRKEILEKLARGDITPEEAERLLDAPAAPDPEASGAAVIPPHAPPQRRRTGLAMGCLAAVIVSLIMAFLGLLLLFGFLFVAKVSSPSRQPSFEEIPAGAMRVIPSPPDALVTPPAMVPPPVLPAPGVRAVPPVSATAAEPSVAEDVAVEPAPPAEPQDSDTQPPGGE